MADLITLASETSSHDRRLGEGVQGDVRDQKKQMARKDRGSRKCARKKGDLIFDCQ